MIRIALNEQDFRGLVAGKTVYAVNHVSGGGIPVEIILSDIGWSRMHAAIIDAINSATDNAKEHS
jgi:hypothetical protein